MFLCFYVLAMSPLIVENFLLILQQSLNKYRLQHMLNAVSYKDSTFNGDIAYVFHLKGILSIS